MLEDILDLEQFPIDRPGTPQYRQLLEQSRASLAANGMFNLEGFLRRDAAKKAAGELAALMQTSSFLHKRQHNIYFRKQIDGLPAGHPALKLCETVNHTLCADQIPQSTAMAIYRFAPLLQFLADAMGKPRLYLMDDPLACANVIAYRKGEALNWHFDRSEFTTTLLLQAPRSGAEFEYRSDLRSDEDPNYDGVAKLLEGRDPQLRSLKISAGTLNVFRGKNTAHRVTPVVGKRERVIAVFSFYERPGVQFSEEERVGFYGRAG